MMKAFVDLITNEFSRLCNKLQAALDLQTERNEGFFGSSTFQRGLIKLSFSSSEYEDEINLMIGALELTFRDYAMMIGKHFRMEVFGKKIFSIGYEECDY
jgi:hypothetical protein